MASWQTFQKEWMEDLQQAYSIMGQALADGRLPSKSDVPRDVMVTVIGTAFMASSVMLMLVPRARKLVWDIVETILATILLLLLTSVVLGLPFGALYIGFKGVAFVLSSTARAFPQLGELSASMYHHLLG